MRVSLLAAALVLAACAGARADPPHGGALAASYPEGPLYQSGALYFAEMGADRIRVYADGQARTFFAQPGCGPTAIAPYGAGFLVLCHVGARVVAIDANGALRRSWSADDRNVRLRDPNDASADGHGGVYFSDPGLFSRNTRPHGRVMHLSADGVLRSVAGPLWYPNGVFMDRANRQLYVSEHLRGRVLRYDIGADGELGPARVHIDLARIARPERYATPYAETGPDGLEIGPNGDLFVAIYGEGRVLRFSPEGALVGMFETPTRYLTNIAFDAAGGAVTTGSFDNLTPPFPGEVRFHEPAEMIGAR